jgi:predicted transcriptional regulator
MQEIKEIAWNLSCLDSFSEYKETELHVNQLEVEKWMDSWGTDTELQQPACHR